MLIEENENGLTARRERRPIIAAILFLFALLLATLAVIFALKSPESAQTVPRAVLAVLSLPAAGSAFVSGLHHYNACQMFRFDASRSRLEMSSTSTFGTKTVTHYPYAAIHGLTVNLVTDDVRRGRRVRVRVRLDQAGDEPIDLFSMRPINNVHEENELRRILERTGLPLDFPCLHWPPDWLDNPV